MTTTLNRIGILAAVATIGLFGAASAPAFSEDGEPKLVTSETNSDWLMCVPAKSIVEGAFWVPDLNRSAMLKIDSGRNVVIQDLAARMVYSEGNLGAGFGGVWVATPTVGTQ